MERYIYYGNDKLALYCLRSNCFYALDSDVAAFLGIPLSSMLLEMHIKDSDYRNDLRIECTDAELNEIGKFRGVCIKRFDGAKIYGFSFEGVVMLAYGVGRGDRVKNAAQELIHEYIGMFKKIFKTSETGKRSRKIVEKNRKTLVDLELAGKNLHGEDKEKHEISCKDAANSLDQAYKDMKEACKSAMVADSYISSIPGGLKPIVTVLNKRDRKVKHIVYGGKKLKLIYMRGDHYAVDLDIARFFNVNNTSLRRQAETDICKYYRKTFIFSSSVPGVPALSVNNYRYCFSLEGIITIALRLNNPESDRFVYEIVKGSSRLTRSMNLDIGLPRITRVYLLQFNSWLVGQELQKHKFTENEMQEYERIRDDHYIPLIEALHKSWMEIFGRYIGPIKKFSRDMPEGIKALMLPFVDEL